MFANASYFSCGNAAGIQQDMANHYKWCQAKGVGLCNYEGGPGGKCDSTNFTAFLTLINQYLDGPYDQYTNSGREWGAVENGYYCALAAWAKNHTCHPTSIKTTLPDYKMTAQTSGTIHGIGTARLYTPDGRSVGLTTAKKKHGCFIAIAPQSGSRVVVMMK
jgi:hypothetical protein